MTSHHRRTPCIGICSTTYGDLVCRGCKRFAHEIVQWNGYEVEQQQTVWARLRQLRIETINRHLKLIDKAKLEAARISYAIAPADWQLVGWQLLKVMDPRAPLHTVGFDRVVIATKDNSNTDLAVRLDEEFYAISLAYYERSFRTLAQ